jgi:hypothetical protein
MLDKDTVNRILHLHKVQGLSPQVIGQRFGFSTGRIHGVIRRQAGLAARAQRDAAQFNLKLKLKNKQSFKHQAASSKRLEKDTMI